MSKKQRMGSDPFSWIKDSRHAAEPEAAAPDLSPSPGEMTATPTPKEQARPPQPTTSDGGDHDEKTTHRGLPVGWKRHTFIIQEGHLEKIQAVAYWERRGIKDIIDEALSLYLDQKEIPELPPR